MRWWTPRVNKAYQPFMAVVTNQQPPDDSLGLNGTTCLSNMPRACPAQISNAAPVPRPLAVGPSSSTLNSFFACASSAASSSSTAARPAAIAAASSKYDGTTNSSAGRIVALSRPTPELTAQFLAAALTSKAGWPRVLHIGTGEVDCREARIGFPETLLEEKKQMNLHPSSSNLRPLLLEDVPAAQQGCKSVFACASARALRRLASPVRSRWPRSTADTTW